MFRRFNRITCFLMGMLCFLHVAHAIFGETVTPREIKRLLALEKSLKAQIAEMESDIVASSEFNSYKAAYYRALPKTFRHVRDDEIVKRLMDAQYVFLGDDHSVLQSQLGAVEILKCMAAGKGNLTLVLEWMDESFQGSVNEFLRGRMSISELKKKIKYDELWGFLWAGYSRVLHAAKRYGCRILLAERLLEKHSLKIRDAYIAKKIADDRLKNASMRYLIVYGEYHILGDDHLSKKLARAGLTPQMILTGNADEIYWKALKSTQQPDSIRFLDMGAGIYYMRNGTPLERLVAYRNYLMKLLGWKKSDFAEWIDNNDILINPGSSERFEDLHRCSPEEIH